MSKPVYQPSRYASFMQETTIHANGLEFYVEKGGRDGDPVIFLVMGLGMQMLGWPNEFCAALVDAGFQVYRYDNRDVGLSSKLPGKIPRLNMYKMMARAFCGLPNRGAPYTVYDMATDASAIIQALETGPVHVLGASMGGMIAQVLAARHPQQVKTLNILFSSNLRAFLPPPGPRQLAALMLPPPDQKRQTLIDTGVRRFEVIGSPARYRNDADLYKMVTAMVDRNVYPKGVLRHILAVLCTGSLVGEDKKISAPTLVMHGSEDRLLWPADGRAIHHAIRGSRFHLIRNMGHDIMPHFIPEIVGQLVAHIRHQGQ